MFSFTFLFTDIEGSTRLWEDHPEWMEAALARHDRILRSAIEARGGVVFKTIGDAFCAVFDRSSAAAEAAVAAQKELAEAAEAGESAESGESGGSVARDVAARPTGPSGTQRLSLADLPVELRGSAGAGPHLTGLTGTQPLRPTPPPPIGGARSVVPANAAPTERRPPESAPAIAPNDPTTQQSPTPHLRVRMAIHAGPAEQRDGDYFGPSLNRVARLLAAAHGGQILVSRAARDLLPPSFHLADRGSHRLKDLQQPEWIFQLQAPGLPFDFPPLKTLRNTNLPIQATAFIGRQAEMAEIAKMLGSGRLLTLVGSGGSGKSRLALQSAAELAGDYPDGVWLAELAALSSPGLVAQAVAAAVGVAEEPGRPLLPTLTEQIGRRTLLLILDNCEHLVGEVAGLAQSLLAACPGLRILATSREPLNIPGERPWRVPSLLPPEPRKLPARGPALVEAVAASDAVRLFMDRAVVQRPDFDLNARNARDVASICYRLDGIPLALELAAARVRSLTVEQIAGRLDDRFRLLTGGSRTGLPRQQTLRGLLDWSYDLLTPPEKALLQRVSVFAGGWTLEAAEAVCAGGEVEEWEVLDLLSGLVDKSLVVFDDRDEAGRYRLLESVRQYGAERLREERSGGVAELGSGGVAGSEYPIPNTQYPIPNTQHPTTHQRHADYYLQLAREASAHLTGPDQAAWYRRLDLEYDNVRAAQDWFLQDPAGAEPGLQLCMSMARFWQIRGHMQEGLQRLQAALARDGGGPPSVDRAAALHTVGNLTFMSCRYDEARDIYTRAFALRQEVGDRRGMAGTLASLGNVAQYQGDYARAMELFKESLEINREVGNRMWEAANLTCLASVLQETGDDEAALPYVEQAVALNRADGNLSALANSLTFLGDIHMHLGRLDESRRTLEEGLRLAREVGDAKQSCAIYSTLAEIDKQEGAYEAARANIEEALRQARTMADARSISTVLEGLATLCLTTGQPVEAARWLGAAEGVREAIRMPLQSHIRAEHDATLAAAREAMDGEVFASAWSEGRAMSWEKAVEAVVGS